MEFKLKKPIRSLTGAAEITSVSMRELVAEDLVEGFASADKLVKQIHTMVCRCSDLLKEEIGKLAPADYARLQTYVADQLNETDDQDPKGETTSSK